MRKKIAIWSASVLGCSFAVIGVPLLINEAYKVNSGYITLWGAPEVLSYYGTILGAAIAISTLTVTILFTRMQIKRESYLNDEQTKWKQIEALSLQCIEQIDPTVPLRDTMEAGQRDPYNSIRVFQQYQMTCRTATDYFLAYLGEAEFNNLQKLLQKISNTSEIYFDLAGKEIENYNKLTELQGRNDALKVLDIERATPNTFPAEMVQYCRKIVRETDNITLDQIQAALRDTNQKIISTYEMNHRPLLQAHRAAFNKISKEIQENADAMLRLWRK